MDAVISGSGWEHHALVFFALMLTVGFVSGESLSENPAVVAAGLFMAVPSALLGVIGATAPLLAPVAFIIMVGYLFNGYRAAWGDAGFMVIAGSFLALVAGV
ncbi:hypothetical protein HY572_06435 [Candidatus Micrarchaeota archaeon]|nr:hypothetical protein [Candidatus Micrarchaeota archaeon]